MTTPSPDTVLIEEARETIKAWGTAAGPEITGLITRLADALSRRGGMGEAADLWLTPEVTEDGEVIDIICRSPDASRLLTIAVHPDKVYITEPRPEGWRKQTLTRAQSPVSRPAGEEVERLAEAAWRGARSFVGGSERGWDEMTDWVKDQWRASARGMLSTLSAERDAMEGAKELELAEKLVRAKAAGSREQSQYRLNEISDCIRQGGDSWGVADWDDVRDYVFNAAKSRAALQHKGETDEQG